MYSSPKFFVPRLIVTLDGDAEPVDVVVVVLLPPPPPQAASPIRSGIPKEIANAALAARRVCLRNMQSPPLVVALSGPVLRGTLRPRGHSARRRTLGQRQRKGRQECHTGD